MDSSTVRRSGFILPSLIVLSLVLMSMGLVTLQYVASSTSSVQTAFYNNLAKEAANAGASFAYNCLKDNGGVAQWTASLPLGAKTSCAGATPGPTTSGYLSSGANNSWKSSFSVGTVSSDPLNGGISFVSTGKVEFFYAGSTTPTRSFEQTTRVNIPYDLSASVVKRAVGKAVTQMETGANTNCAVANSQLYCWGINNVGQMAQGGSDNTSRTSPTQITTGSLAGKRITYAAIGYTNGCAIADGRAYCWGINQRGQLGTGSAPPMWSGSDWDFLALFTATRYQPTKVNGPLATANVTKISQSWTDDSNADREHACALSNGVVYCWGSNFWGQLGQPHYGGDFLCAYNGWGSADSGWPLYLTTAWLCRRPEFTAAFSNNDLYAPTPIFGFGSRAREEVSLLYQKRALDFDTGHYGDCAIANGTVYCWGNALMQATGSSDPRGGLTNVSDSQKTGDLSGKYATSIANASTSACAVADGQMQCWGRLRGDGIDGVGGNDTPKTVSSLPGGNVVIDKVESSTELSGPICGVGSGDAYCWGFNSPGVISPIRIGQYPVNPGESITDVGAGGGASGFFGIFGTPGNSCYVGNATVYCIGNNQYGQLGIGSTSSTASVFFARTTTANPANTIGLTEGKAATNISAGNDFTCAIIDGQPFCWGNNTSGQLGVGDTLQRTHPYGVNNLPSVTSSTKVDAGYGHACSITGGKAFCWGNNTSGQIGNGTSGSIPQRTATQVVGSGSNSIQSMAVTDISAGRDHTCAVANGRAYCWGSNTYGQLGTGNTTSTTSPVAVQATSSGDALYGKQVTKIAAGDRFTCAIADGQPYCWGERASGKIGNGGATTGNTTSPVAVSSMTGTSTDIEAGPDYACAIQGGIPYCWGENQYYQLGIGNTTDQTTPTVNPTLRGSASDPNNTTSISLGASSACAITNGITYCWGSRVNGQIGNGGSTTGNSTTPVAITEVNSATDLGPQNIPTQVTSGGFGSCAIANARLYCWGEGSVGKMGNDTNTSSSTPTVTADYSRDNLVVSWDDTIFY